jgi:two-component system sensor histidine kinase DegS
VWVTFSDNDEHGCVELMIRDDGVGFNPLDLHHRTPQDASFGVKGMHERVELVGGELVVESTPNHGTLIVARIPIAAHSTDGEGTES